MSKIQLEDLTKEFGQITATKDVSISIQDGEFFTIVGPSGCGKSTTLRMIAGFERPTSGDVKINGKDVTDQPPDDRDVGLVFQNYALFPHMTAGENIEFGLRMEGVSKQERTRRVARMLELIDLPGIESQYPDELSGGQQQRIALARALVIEPDVLLLDEPLSNLDKQLRESLQGELKRIQQETGVTTIHVTHNQEEAMTLADRMCVLNQGEIEQIASPREVYTQPKTPFVSKFVGKANTYDATAQQTNDGVTISIDEINLGFECEAGSDGERYGGSGLLVIRPEKVQLTDSSEYSPPHSNSGTMEILLESNHFEATVRDQQFKGEKTRYELTITEDADSTIKMAAHSRYGFDSGEELVGYVDPTDLIFIPNSREE